MESVMNEIKKIRQLKGYSHEYMAHELDMSTSAYTKLERLDTKLTVERLFRIADILEAPVNELLKTESKNTYNQELKDSSIGHQEVQNLYQENKEAVTRLISTKDEVIEQLKEEVGFLRGLLKDK